MKLRQFDYFLPENLIATYPAEPRDSAKMLVLDQESEEFRDSYFSDLPNFLKRGDVLVLNDSKVIPARLYAESKERKFEVLLVKNIKDALWETWVRPGRKAKIGELFQFSEKLKAKLIKRENEIFYFEFNMKGQEFFAELDKIGEMPVPPYILKARGEKGVENEDIADYQTVFAEKAGSVAAPTASLHFTKELLERLQKVGVQIEKVTLHVGLGTFQPVTTEKVEDFQIHSEYFEIAPAVADRLNQAKAEGRRIIAVGTTAVRVLESAATSHPEFISGSKKIPKQVRNDKFIIKPFSGETSIYIYPGYKFKFIDGMITNFHLPKSSLLLLVASFIGIEKTKKAYQYAIQNKYKFYSYGDGMLIL